MNGVETKIFFENLSEIQKDFVNIIIEIVKDKYESLRETHSDCDLLENITLKPYYFVGYYVGRIQDIARRRGRNDREPIDTANTMLSELCRAELLVVYSKGIYRLKKDGELYKHLAEVLDSIKS